MKARLFEVRDALWNAGTTRPESHDPFMRRLVAALVQARGGSDSVRPGDVASLIRQAVLRASITDAEPREIIVPDGPGWPDRAMWTRFSCDALAIGAGRLRVRPLTWQPTWLDHGAAVVVSAGTEEIPRRHTITVPADPALLEHLKWKTYSSAGQRAAVQAAFLSPPGSTTIACLPTGGGKSLAFQLPTLAWQASGGLTVVITPTVALARDQEARFKALLKSIGRPVDTPLAFHSGLDSPMRGSLVGAIRSGSTPIVFASPEAAIGLLRDSLFDAARQGRLRLFVVDEAHLVAQWGEEFRPEFQSLAGLRDALLEACPPTIRFRTLLLSATLTPETVESLRSVFGSEESQLVGALELRPEIGFLISTAPNEATRAARVLEAVDHLPKPMILYTTRRDHAERWFDDLRAREYGRLRLIRGGDLAGEGGARVLEGWRNSEFDIVVATSAFGVGIDQTDVRTVIHACLPETIDRYYQEVGRAGRDGNAAVSLLVTAPEDTEVAEDLAKRRRISVERGFERWLSMWIERRQQGNGTYVLRLDASPPDISSPGQRNEAWNLRTLVLMARAGLIRFAAHEPPPLLQAPGEDADTMALRHQQELSRFYREIAIRLGEWSPADPAYWRETVANLRRLLYGQDARAYDLIRELLNLTRPLNDIFTEVYTLRNPSARPPRLWGSCPFTRARNAVSFVSADPETIPLVRASPAADTDLVRAVGPCTDDARRSWISYMQPPSETLELRHWRQRITIVLRQLAARGVGEFRLPEGMLTPKEWMQILAVAPNQFIVRASSDADPFESLHLPRLSFLDHTETSKPLLDEILRLPRPLHIIMVPRDAPDPSRRGAALLERVHHFDVETLQTRLGK